MVQRFSSAKNIRTAQFALLLNVPGVFLMTGSCCFCGLVVYAAYYKCDPLTMPNTPLNSANQILPYYVINKLTSIRGSAGLFLSAIFAGALSSVSSSLNSSAAILWQDFLKLFDHFKTYNDNKSTLTTKLLVFLCGALATGLAFLVSTIGGNLITMNFSLNGAFNAPIIGVFILGSCFPFSNKYGASVGLVAGFAMGLWLSIGSNIYKPLYPKLNVSIAECNLTASTESYTTQSSAIPRAYGEASNLTGFNKFYSLSYMWFTALGTLTTIITGIIVSLFTKCNKKSVDVKYLLCKCYKNKIRESKSEEFNLKDLN